MARKNPPRKSRKAQPKQSPVVSRRSKTAKAVCSSAQVKRASTSNLFEGDLSDLSDSDGDDEHTDNEDNLSDSGSEYGDLAPKSRQTNTCKRRSPASARSRARPQAPIPRRALPPHSNTSVPRVVPYIKPAAVTELKNAQEPPRPASGQKRKKQSQAQAAKQKERKKEKKKAKRTEQRRTQDIRDSWRRCLDSARPVMLPLFDITQRPLTEGGWHGWPRHGIKRRTDRDIDELVTCGIQIYSLENSAGADVPILDRNLRRWGLYRCVDQSSDGQARQAEQTESMKIAAGSTRWKDGGRGNFGVGRDGVMHEQGTQRPWRPANTPKQRDAMQLIFDNEAWKKDAQQSDIAWQTFNPTMHKLHCDVRKALEYQFDDLHWNWDTLPQGLTTFNFGPQVVCRDHADPKDFPTWANLKAFGDFDHKRGGHVVFWDLGIAIELPPGAEIWFPSALLLHSNTVIGKHETRYSATSYSSGGAFQWVYRGGLWPEYHDEAFPDVAELNEHRAAAFWDIAFPVWN